MEGKDEGSAGEYGGDTVKHEGAGEKDEAKYGGSHSTRLELRNDEVGVCYTGTKMIPFQSSLTKPQAAAR